MSVITVFRASFCRGEEIARGAADRLGYRILGDEEVLARASEGSGVRTSKIRKAFSGTPGLSLNPGLARARLVARVKLAVSELLAGDRIVFEGLSGLFVPGRVTHVLRVCLVASAAYRMDVASGAGVPEKRIENRLRDDDEEAAAFADHVTGRSPWDRRLYDLRLPVHELGVERVVEMVVSNAGRKAVAVRPASEAAWEDFRLAARAAVRWTEAGHDVDVRCEKGVLEAIVNRSVLSMERFADKLEKELEDLAGVKEVRARAGREYPAGTFYREEEFQVPRRVLLVDDESEFVMALSERLQMRDIGATLARNGEEALDLVEKEEPEVVVLDLRMPGIDGIEVLRRLKRDHPVVEVIILTGHGSEEDRRLAMELGAFAYLQKPVDIEELTRTMEEANEKIRRSRADEDTEDDG